jgi:hypothetical protein
MTKPDLLQALTTYKNHWQHSKGIADIIQLVIDILLDDIKDKKTTLDLSLVSSELKLLEKLQKTLIKPIHVMQTYQCLSCEKELRDTWRYCPYCGVELDWTKVGNENE